MRRGYIYVVIPTTGSTPKMSVHIFVALFTSSALGQCHFLDEHCYLGDDRQLTCVLQGDKEANEPRLDHILAQTVIAESENHKGCPILDLSRKQIMKIILLPCEGMLDFHVRGIISDEDPSTMYPKNNLNVDDCNQTQFTIQHALFDDLATTKFKGGIHLMNAYNIDHDNHPLNRRPMIKRAAGSFSRDGTCNVINNGMHDVSIKGLELNNEDCVDDEVPPSEMGGALKKYGPDTM